MVQCDDCKKEFQKEDIRPVPEQILDDVWHYYCKACHQERMEMWDLENQD